MSMAKGPELGATFGALPAVVLAAALAVPLPASGEIRISIEHGQVTLEATGARLADVLAEWSRVGGTRFVGAEPLGGEAITLHLVDAAEAEAIGLLLSSAAGFVAAPRSAGASGASRYDRVTILATRAASAPARIAAAPPDRETPVAAPAVAGGARTPDRPALVSMEELQRLLNAAANAGDASSDAVAVPAVVTTPFPGVGADPGSSPLPARWRPDRP